MSLIKLTIMTTVLALFGSTEGKILEHDNNLIGNSDFLSGFEQGFFLRGQQQMLKDYGCHKSKAKSSKAKKMDNILEPMKIALQFVPDKDMKNQLNTVQLFLESYTNIMAVFESDFDQGDYCMGMIFGLNGAEMLTDIAHITLGLDPQYNDHPNPAKAGKTKNPPKANQ